LTHIIKHNALFCYKEYAKKALQHFEDSFPLLHCLTQQSIHHPHKSPPKPHSFPTKVRLPPAAFTMSSSHIKTGIIVAGISVVVVIALCIGIIMLRGRLPFTFSRYNLPYVLDIEIASPPTDGEYEKYGELYVAPDKQPTVAALDIMTRMLMVTGLPPKATVSDSSSSSVTAVEIEELPIICLTRPDCDSLNTLDSKGMPVGQGAEAQALRHAIAKDRRVVEDMRDATRRMSANQNCSSEKIEVVEDGGRKSGETQEEEMMVDPLSFSVGSGQSMAELYRY
jgi:hypothetical protein